MAKSLLMPLHRTTYRLILATLLIGALAAYGIFLIIKNRSGAEDILSMQGVRTCSTSRDLNGGKHQCPGQEKYATTCAEAEQAVKDLNGIKLLTDITQVTPQPGTAQANPCELKAVDAANGIYAIVVHAYYAVGVNAPSISNNPVRSQASSSLYDSYTNFYQSYLSLDLSTTSLGQGLIQAGLYQSYTPAFLVSGEPGFRMQVKTVDQTGVEQAGAGTLIKVFCGDASDIMVAEPSGNSWFSFAGYAALNCGTQPLQAQVIVQRTSTGNWTPNTASYSYLYQPADAVSLEFQNRPQAPQTTFLGKWQGLEATVQGSSKDVDQNATTAPLSNMSVTFTCAKENSSPLTGAATLLRTTDARGQAVVSLADAQYAIPGCTEGAYSATLAGVTATDSPAYDYYFPTTGPITAGTVNGTDVTPGLFSGQALEIGGKVRLNDVGGTPGGLFADGSRICLFLTLDAAKSTAGCPSSNAANILTTTADAKGEYLFGGSGSHLSYGQYVAAGSGAVEIRILNYKGDAYPASISDNNDKPLDPKDLNMRDIRLPSAKNDLMDHVCQAVVFTWNNVSYCQPLYNIIMRESGWSPAATNGSSGACGLFQSNPCSKYQTTVLPGEDYRSIGNQIRWGVAYVKDRYNNPVEAWAFWQAHNHY